MQVNIDDSILRCHKYSCSKHTLHCMGLWKTVFFRWGNLKMVLQILEEKIIKLIKM